MSDETPRELTEQEIDDLLWMRASVWRREAMDVNGLTGVVVPLGTLQSLCHMARRGARVALAARLTPEVLIAARDAWAATKGPAMGVPPVHPAWLAMRAVLLDALTGAGEET